jgi:hypothetical protein
MLCLPEKHLSDERVSNCSALRTAAVLSKSRLDVRDDRLGFEEPGEVKPLPLFATSGRLRKGRPFCCPKA